MSASKWKPYPEYKPTNEPWIPSIPLHWETKPLQFVFEEKKNPNKAGNEKNVLSLSYGKIIRKDISKNLGLLPASFDTYNIVEPESIILRLTDLQNDKKSLRVGLVNERGIITSAYLCIKSKTSSMNRYGYLLLHAFDLTKIFYAIGDGVRQSMGYEQMRKLGIAIPSKNEREKIIEFCEHIDSTIERLVESLQEEMLLLKEKCSALITKAVTKGLNPDVTMKDSGIEKIPEHWEVINLRYLLKHKITDGPHETPVFVDEGFPFLSVDGIQEGELVFEGCRFISQKDHIEYSRKVKPMKGDLLMGKAASTGKIAQVKVDFEFSIWSPLAWIRPNNMITSDFLEFALKGEYIQSQVEMLCTISTQKNISMQDIPRIKVIIPPKAEQKEISDYIKKSTSIISEQKQILTKQILKLKEYRTALISAAVTGKIDVRESV